MKRFAAATKMAGAFGDTSGQQLWSKLRGEKDPEELLGSVGEIGDFASFLLWSRKQFGYEFGLNWADRDRPLKKFRLFGISWG